MYDYDKIWLFFESNLGYNYQETKEFIKCILEMDIKLYGLTPCTNLFFFIIKLEMDIKLYGLTPIDIIWRCNSHWKWILNCMD